VKADLTSEAQVKQLFSRAMKAFGRIDTLIANAGWWETQDVPLHKMSLGHWQRTIEGVLTTCFLTVREFLQVAARQKQGNAVLIASTAAVFGEAVHADYSSGKAAIAMVVEHNCHAFGSECSSDGRADTTGSAGHEHDFAGQFRIHAYPGKKSFRKRAGSRAPRSAN